MNYIVMTSSDGEISIDVMDSEELEEKLNNEEYGDKMYPANFLKLEDLEENTPPYWSHQDILIIRGDAIIPRKVTTVTKWEV